MKKILAAAGSIVFLATVLSAEPVALSGTVKDAGGSAVEGVEISLANIGGISGITDAQGSFTIAGTGVNGSYGSGISFPARMCISGTGLLLSFMPAGSKGCVDIFSSDGRRNLHLQFERNNGEVTLKFPQLTPGLHLMRLTAENETVTRTIVSIGKSDIYFADGPVQKAGAVLAKRNAANAVDTLIAVKTGFGDAKVPIDSYEKEGIEIVMREDGPGGPMPLVYDVENTGEDCPKPDLVDDPTTLPSIEHLPDPFLMVDGETRMSTRAQWRCRRAEIREMIMKYGIGVKPGKPEAFEASLSGDRIGITCGVGGNVINLSATISRPSGAPDEPIPAIINKASLQFDFKGRGIAEISINESDIVSSFFSGGFRDGNFYKLYPNTDAGYMVRAAWLVSRIIDALEELPEANIDTKHLAVSGCSYGGKIALYSGALDERIALTIPHESGGGGTISWRYSDMLEERDNTEVENLHHAQGAAWYSDALRIYQPNTVSPNTLPYDHHELMGLCLPRALFCIESSMIARMGAEAARVDALAVRRMYEAFDAGDRFGVTEDNVNHCTWSGNYNAGLTAFVDKFLLGKDDVETDYLESKFQNIDEVKWIPWEVPDLH